MILDDDDDGPSIKREPLYQVYAEETKTGKLVAVPMFPRALKVNAEEWVALMQEQIRLGNEKRYSNPQAAMHLTGS